MVMLTVVTSSCSRCSSSCRSWLTTRGVSWSESSILDDVRADRVVGCVVGTLKIRACVALGVFYFTF